MVTRIKDFFKKHCPVLFEETMPVWLTIFASIAAAALTYWFAPIYNRQFQIEDTKSAYLTKATDNLNNDIMDLSLKIRRLNAAIANNDKKMIELREESLDLVTRLQWRLVDLRVILQEGSDKKVVDDLSSSIDRLKRALDRPNDANYALGVKAAMGDLASSTETTLGRLYQKAALKS